MSRRRASTAPKTDDRPDPVVGQVKALRHLYSGTELAQKVSFRLGRSVTVEQIEQILNEEPEF